MKRFLIFILPLFFLVSCTSAPKQKNYPPSMQSHMQAAKHWEVMAKSFADEVAQVLQERQSPLSKEYSLRGDFGHSMGENSSQIMHSGYYGPIYIDKRDQSAFGKAFRTLLITELWKYNLQVVDSPDDAYSISWGCQKIFHENDRRDIFPGIPLLAGATAGYLIFGGDANIGKPNWEIIITLNLHVDDSVMLRDTDIRYVNNKDIVQYKSVSDLIAKSSSKKSLNINYAVVDK